MNRQGWLAFQGIGRDAFTAARMFFLSFFGCVIAAHGQSTAPAASTPDIVTVLTRAKAEKIELSRAEKEVMKGHGWHADDIKKCNRNDYYDAHSNQDGSSLCDFLASGLETWLGVTSHTAELAYLRACVFHHQVGDPCYHLGSFYEKRGDYAAAMAVFLYAPNCEQEGDSYWSQRTCLSAADPLSVKMADKELQAKVLKRLCRKFSDPYSCERLNKQFGGSEDVAAANSSYQALTNTTRNSSWASLGTQNDDRSQQAWAALGKQGEDRSQQAWAALGKSDDDDGPAQQEPKQNALDTAISVLQSMPGASDPNAIVNAANRQGAQMIAIGAANDAARRQAAQDRLAAQQAVAQAQLQQQQAAQARLAIQQSSARPAAPASASSSGAWNGLQNRQSAANNSAASASSANGVAATENSASSAATAANYAAPLSASCIREFWDPNNYKWLSFQNTCTQALRVDFIAANPDDTFGMSTKDLAPGQADSTGWSQSDVSRKRGFVLFVCPAGYLAVDSATDQPIRRANEDFRCKQR